MEAQLILIQLNTVTLHLLMLPGSEEVGKLVQAPLPLRARLSHMAP